MDNQVIITAPYVPAETSSQPESGQQVLFMEQTIKENLSAIDGLRTDMKKHKQMLKDLFDSNAVLKQHEEQAKEANTIYKSTKDEVLKQPQAADLSQKIKDLQQEIKDLTMNASEVAKEYTKVSGVNEIETSNGQVMDIVLEAKLMKRSRLAR